MTLTTPAQALWNQRFRLADALPRLRALIDAVGRPTDLAPFQWAQLFAFTLDFQPDLIVELGRGYGNSTCCFLEAAARMEQPCRVVSLCLTDVWFSVTRPRLKQFCPDDWFARGELIQENILHHDIESRVAKARRCLVFWDAHGFDVAEWVLGKLLPAVADRPHHLAMHDLCDLRYCKPSPRYEQCGLWKGENASDTGFWLWPVFSRVAQAISIIDFTCRNQLPLHSADHSLHEEIAGDPTKQQELRDLLGPDFFDLQAHWFWFSLNEGKPPFTFPPCPPPPAVLPAPASAAPAIPRLSPARLVRRLMLGGLRRASRLLGRSS